VINNVYTHVLFRNYVKHTLPLTSFSSKTLTQHLEGVTECSGSAESHTRSMMVQLGYVKPLYNVDPL
jgi:hypothetical protein